MKVEIIKQDLREVYSGDILSITDGHEQYTYLFFEEEEMSAIGAIDMGNGQVEVRMSSDNEFIDVIRIIEEKIGVATEYKVFSNNKVKLVLGEQ